MRVGKECAIFEKRKKIFLKIDIFACANRRVDRVGQTLPLIGKLPGNHVLVPGQAKLVQRLAQANTGLNSDMAKMVNSQGHFITDLLAHLSYIITENIDSLVANLNPCKLVHDVIGFQHAGRRDQCIVNTFEQTDTNVHFEEAETVLQNLDRTDTANLLVVILVFGEFFCAWIFFCGIFCGIFCDAT